MHKIGATCEIYHSNVVNEDEEVEEVEVEEMKVSEDREKEVKAKKEDNLSDRYIFIKLNMFLN